MNNVTYPRNANAPLELQRRKQWMCLTNPEQVECPECSGAGVVAGAECPMCEGHGTTEADEADEWSRGICTICGEPEPCSKRACIDALIAQADYWEGTSDLDRTGGRP